MSVEFHNPHRCYVVHCKVNGSHRETRVYAASSFEARQQVKRDQPGAVDIYAVVAR